MQAKNRGTFLLFLIVFILTGCSSTKIVRENTWAFLKQNNEKIHYYPYSEQEIFFSDFLDAENSDSLVQNSVFWQENEAKKIHAPTKEIAERSENQKFIFLRLYNPYSSYNVGGNLLQKGIEITETHNTSGSHLSIGFDLTDNFYGLTLYAKPNLKIEQCTDTSTNEYMKSCNPKKSLQTTYAVPVTQAEYDEARTWVQKKSETPSVHYDVSENFKIAGVLLNPNPNAKKVGKALSYEEEVIEFEKMNKFVCSTFVCHVLYSSVGFVRDYLNENLIDPDLTTPTDIISIPGIKKLFTSNWNDYNIAAQNFAQMNPSFLEYL